MLLAVSSVLSARVAPPAPFPSHLAAVSTLTCQPRRTPAAQPTTHGNRRSADALDAQSARTVEVLTCYGQHIFHLVITSDLMFSWIMEIQFSAIRETQAAERDKGRTGRGVDLWEMRYPICFGTLTFVAAVIYLVRRLSAVRRRFDDMHRYVQKAQLQHLGLSAAELQALRGSS